MSTQKPFRNCYLSKTNAKLNISPNSESPMMLHVPSLARVSLNRPDIHQEIVANYIKYSDKYWAEVYIRQRAYLQQQQQEKLELSLQMKQSYVNFLPKQTAYRIPMDPRPNARPALNSVDVVLTHASLKSVWRELWSCIKPRQ